MHTPYMIAITGGSGSGKSTLANALLEKLGPDMALAFGEDNYYRPRESYGVDAPLWSLEQMEQRIDFDNPESKDMALFEMHVDALRRGESVVQPHYDFSRHDRDMGRQVTLDPRPVIIVEGLHVLCEPRYFTLFDLTVFVETPPDLRLARRIQRDVRERNRELDRVLAQYLTFVRPAHARFTEPAKFMCDLVIHDEGPLASTLNAPDEKAQQRLIAPVWGRLIDDNVIDPPSSA